MMVNATENIQEKSLNQEKIDTEPVQAESNLQNNQQSVAPETPEDPNWKAFREARKKDRADREAAERKAAEKEAEVAALKAAMEAAFTKSPPVQQQQYGYDQQQAESEDERIEKKVRAAIAAREAESEKLRAQREMQEYPNRLQRDFPDFQNVISQENRDYLDYHYPEISRPLSRLPDGYDKWHDIYHAIKKFIPNNSSVRKDSARADSNFNKPKSISSTGLTQSQETSSSNILSEERKAANWARMQKARKGLS